MNVEGREQERGNDGQDPGRQRPPEGDETEGPGNVSVDEPTDPALNPDEEEIDSDRD